MRGLLLLSFLFAFWHNTIFHEHHTHEESRLVRTTEGHEHDHSHSHEHTHNHGSVWQNLWNLLKHPIHPDSGEHHLDVFLPPAPHYVANPHSLSFLPIWSVVEFSEPDHFRQFWNPPPDIIYRFFYDPPSSGSVSLRGPPASV